MTNGQANDRDQQLDRNGNKNNGTKIHDMEQTDKFHPITNKEISNKFWQFRSDMSVSAEGGSNEMDFDDKGVQRRNSMSNYFSNDKVKRRENSMQIRIKQNLSM